MSRRAAGATHRFSRGLRRWSRPLVVSAILAAPIPARAQDPIRPWLDWRTIVTRHYRFHFPRELEEWTRAVAVRVESIDSALTAQIGSVPPRPVDVVVDDPFAISNGYALPFIDRPVTVWWAMPPDPRTDIGNYRTWGEMLSVHELAHITHLTRPSRNPLQRQLWSSLPVNLGPITQKAPRWVYEGYATYIEGRVTGTGRPNNAWRAALLRQWAIEGRLPSYGALNLSSEFLGGDFAYLNGSAFLDWLVRRSGVGDSSLVHLWRRMTARQSRTFEGAFTGVYGEPPHLLYGRHTAEITRDAMAAKAQLERAGLVEGELIQRLAWGTGDPAVSPDGGKVAVVLRERDRPGRVVVWSSAAEPPDTAAIRRRLDMLKRDPVDVPDRAFFPPPKRALKTLEALNGRSFQLPRWLPDNRRLLLTRWIPRADGSVSSALYEWDTESDALRRVTAATGLQNADPHPDAREAVAMQCRAGRCDIARVDLGTGASTALLRGDARRSYYHPRYSPDGRRFVASVSDSGTWRVLVANRDGTDARLIGPADGANRYDAEWRAPDSLVVVSELGGIPNLELLALDGGAPRSATRVTGAAVAPSVSRADGSIWFLSLHSRGLDIRRLASAAAIADSAVAVTADRFGYAGAPSARSAPDFAENPVSAPRAYGSGPRHQRWIPGGFASPDGAGLFIAVFSGDIVGRLSAIATAAFAESGAVSGGSARLMWRHPRPAIEVGGFGFVHDPSRGLHPQPGVDSLDAGLFHGVLAAAGERRGDGWFVRARTGLGAGTLQPELGSGYFRGLGFGEIDLRLSQSRGARGLAERFRVHAAQGHTRGHYTRAVGTVELRTIGRDIVAIEAGATFGRISGSSHPFEQFVIGGATSPVADSALLGQRYAMPMFPTAVAMGREMLAWRAALPAQGWTLFYEGASVRPARFDPRRWHRAAGLQLDYTMPAVPAAFAPRVEIRGGAAYLLDDPFRKKVRLFVGMKIDP